MVKKLCLRCSAPFWRDPGRADRSHFCSKLCQAQYKNTAGYVTDGPNGCWPWVGAKLWNGYGTISIKGKKQTAHRHLYEQIYGPVDAGLEIDHLCRNRLCVNPFHLEPVTPSENVCRSPKVIAARAAISCKRGHLFTPENTKLAGPWLSRVCKVCEQESRRRYQMRKKGDVHAFQ